MVRSAQTRGHIEDGKVRHYQVALKVGFTMEAAAAAPLAIVAALACARGPAP